MRKEREWVERERFFVYYVILRRKTMFNGRERGTGREKGKWEWKGREIMERKRRRGREGERGSKREKEGERVSKREKEGER